MGGVMADTSRGYIGWGNSVHYIAGTVPRGGGWALCGKSGFLMTTEEPVTCKTCLRQAAKEAAKKGE